jgi:hypothetical protein
MRDLPSTPATPYEVRPTQGTGHLLSTVIIARDQEQFVDRLVSSVLREAPPDVATEIVFVDSASSDATASNAAAFPVRVLRLPADRPLTAAAGRYVGYHATDGEYVLFLDGDMELAPGWVSDALQVMAGDRTIAVVGGELIDCPPCSLIPCEPITPRTEPIIAADVRHAGGAALYRRSVLDRIGSFNPFLRSDEEPELCLRIRAAGFRVIRLGAPIAFHYSRPAKELGALTARRKRGLYLGQGQALRALVGTRLFWTFARERGFGLPPIAAAGAGLTALLVGSLAGAWWPASVWAGMFLLTLVLLAVRKRDARATVNTVVDRLFHAEGTIRGFLMRPRNPETYPTQAEIVRR